MSGRGQKGETRIGSSGFRSLFAAILAQALEDATCWTPDRNDCHAVQLRRDRDDARKWLTRHSPRFDLVCDSAGIDADWLIAHAQAKIAEAIASPKPKQRRRKNSEGSKPGVVQNFSECRKDRLTSAARDGAEIEIPQNRDLVPCP